MRCKTKMLFVLSEAKWIGFWTTVLFKALFTLLIYYNTPFTTEGHWCFYFLVLCNFCQYILVKKKSFCIFMLCCKGKKNLPRCVLNQMSVSLPVLVLDFYWKWKSGPWGILYLFDKYFGPIIILKCYIWLHAKLA